MSLELLIVDIVSLIISGGIAIGIWSQINPALKPEFYISVIPLVFVFVVLYALTGLYPAIGISPVEEFRRLTLTTTAVFLGLATISFWVRSVEAYSRASFGLAWILSLFIVPIGRELFRTAATRVKRWGEPVILIGYGPDGKTVLEYLLKNPQVGLLPKAVIQTSGNKESVPNGITVIQSKDILSNQVVPEIVGFHTAILIITEMDKNLLRAVIDELTGRYSHLILMTEILPLGSVWVTPYDMGGILGLELKQNLMSRSQQILKRVLDIGLILLFLPVLIPILCICSLLVVIDSPGGVLYSQYRVGQSGRCIRIWKFRSMAKNADQILQAFLESHPGLQKEWEANRKLKHDPRITRIGAIFRKLSLDELPQLWNVLKGEMSLVGPRPIVDAEILYYENSYYLYARVKPGITGMWQISGRNNMSYAERVRLDAYYVRNWSIWLDVYILARTIFTVLSGKGAY